MDLSRLNPYLAYPAKFDEAALRRLTIVYRIQYYNGVQHLVLSARDWREALREGAVEKLDIEVETARTTEVQHPFTD